MMRNLKGYRIGESHQHAKLTNYEVEMMRELHEKHGISCAEVARKFEINYNTCQGILKYRSRYA
jgi:DNA-binding CsgD family transcriptional regulator